MFDETIDVSKNSQMSLVIRYIYNKNMNECFIEFIYCDKYVYKEQTDDVDDINEEDNPIPTNIESKLTFL